MPDPIVTAPAGGAKISIANGRLSVPNNPIIPFIEIGRASCRERVCT